MYLRVLCRGKKDITNVETLAQGLVYTKDSILLFYSRSWESTCGKDSKNSDQSENLKNLYLLLKSESEDDITFISTAAAFHSDLLAQTPLHPKRGGKKSTRNLCDKVCVCACNTYLYFQTVFRSFLIYIQSIFLSGGVQLDPV